MKKKKNRSISNIIFNIIAYTSLTFIALSCLIPFIIIISGSFTENRVILVEGYSLWPKELSVDSYKAIFRYPDEVLRAYAVTSVNTLVGTFFGLLFISMAGFVLSRKEFKYRNRISFLIYFTTIFGGGLIPWYILYENVLKLGDNFLAICLPMLMTPFLIILMRTFVTCSFPDEVMESAKIDGAGYLKIYYHIMLPIITPGLATIGLLLSLNYWNDWFLSALYMTTPQKFELQYYLYNMLNRAQEMNRLLSGQGVAVEIANLPTESVKLAMAVVATGPVLLFYPLVQRYFIQGIAIGAVKG